MMRNDEKLFRNVLRNTSYKLRDIMPEGVSTKIANLTSEKTNLVRPVKENSTVKEFNLISHFVANKMNKLSHEIKKCHQRKYDRDHIGTLKSKCKSSRFEKSKRKRHDRERKKDWLERRRVTISTAKLNGPDQNAVNLTNIKLSDACKFLLSKGPSFLTTPCDMKWYNLKQNFDNFVNKLRFQLQNSNQSSTELSINNNEQQLEDPPPKKVVKQPIFMLKQLTVIV